MKIRIKTAFPLCKYSSYFEISWNHGLGKTCFLYSRWYKFGYLIVASKIKVLPKTNLHLMDNHPMRLNGELVNITCMLTKFCKIFAVEVFQSRPQRSLNTRNMSQSENDHLKSHLINKICLKWCYSQCHVSESRCKYPTNCHWNGRYKVVGKVAKMGLD